MHQLDDIDAFGFSKHNGERFQMELNLTLKAYILLKEAYPKIEINNPKPITRFILGLKEDIEVTGSKSFLKHLSALH